MARFFTKKFTKPFGKKLQKSKSLTDKRLYPSSVLMQREHEGEHMLEVMGKAFVATGNPK